MCQLYFNNFVCVCVNSTTQGDIYHRDLDESILWTDELLLNTEFCFQFWTVRMGIVSVIIMAQGRQKLFLRELPGGQRVILEGRKKVRFPSLLMILEL